jgi:hypothetical protein
LGHGDGRGIFFRDEESYLVTNHLAARYLPYHNVLDFQN